MLFVQTGARKDDPRKPSSACRALGAIFEDHGDRRVLHVHGEAIAKEQDQYDRQQQADGQIALVAHHLVDFLAHQRHKAPDESGLVHARPPPASRQRRALLDDGDESAVHIDAMVTASLLTDGLRCAQREHAAGILDGDAIAVFGLFHEMGRDDDGDAPCARPVMVRQLTGQRVDAAGRLVEKQDFRLVNSITIDKSGANTAAILSIIADTGADIQMRQNKYLNNIVEQDHRAIKRITRPMMGFKNFHCAQAIIAGIETMHMIQKRQMIPASKGQPLSKAEQFYSLAF
jgi:hypothetical protein